MGSKLSEKYEEYIMNKIEKVWGEVVKDVSKAADKAHISTLMELKKEASNMYNKLIRDYYEYETQCYIRHGQSEPGTGTGENLYRANNIRVQGGKLYIETDYKKMETGYRRHGRNTVLEMVKSGQRYAGRRHDPVPWFGDFLGNYITLSHTYINEAFEDFENNLDDMYNRIFLDKMTSLKGKYKYW